MRRFIMLGMLSILLPGCATLFEGTSQSVTIETDPSGADCTFDRHGTHIGQVNPTPGSIHVDKSKDDLSVQCKHVGYLPATVTESSKFQGTTFGNIVAGGLVGVVVDAASGANFAYPNDVKINMAPDPATAAPAAPQPMSSIIPPISPVSYRR
jgi:hypothetical protein